MAKAIYQCAKCAANIQCSAPSRKEADRLAEYRQQQAATCSDCFAVERAAKLAAEHLAAAERAESIALPALMGSPKQIPWAVTLRDKMLREFEPFAQLARTKLATPDTTPQPVQDAAERILITRELLLEKSSAHWWIEQRMCDPRTLVAVALKAEIDAVLRRRVIAAQTPAEAEAEAAAMEDSLLRPIGEPISQHVCEIALQGRVLTLRTDAYIPALRGAAISADLAWDEAARHWRRLLSSVTSGDPVDCSAELAHCLLSAGLVVRLHDPEARRRAVSGEFAQECRRWVTRASADSQYAGWYAIRWRKPDDLYDDARRIGGSRYKDGTVYAPPGSTDEVLDFAEQHGFQVSPGALETAGQHRAALAAGVVVGTKGRMDTSIRVASADGTPPVLVVPDSTTINADLLDAD